MRVPRYRATFDMAALLESARAGWPLITPSNTRSFSAWLAFVAARSTKPWSAVGTRALSVSATRFRSKTPDSEGDVVVDPELLEIFRGYHARAKDGCVESNSAPNNGKPYDYYRCQSDIQDLIAWLPFGVTSKTPLHAAEYGSQINERYGLTAAQEMLRHADVAVTAAHYVENKQRSVLGFGHILKNDRTIIPIDSQDEKSTDDIPRAALAR